MTTEAPPTNPHATFSVGVGHYYTCKAPDCGYQMFVHGLSNHPAFKDRPEEEAAYWADLWRRSHAEQYGPGRAPDITVDWEISATCSVCPDDKGDVQMCEDGEAVCCQECGTHWTMNGTGGEREDDQ